MEKRDLAKITLQLEGLSCASCARGVEKALQQTDGVVKAQVNFALSRADIEFNPAKIEQGQLGAIVRSAGYGVKEQREKIILKIGGMNCASCAAAVEQSLKQAPGVYDARVNIAAEQGTVEYDPTILTRDDLKKIVIEAGYQVVGVAGEQRTGVSKDQDLKKVDAARKKMWGSWLFTIPIILWMIPEMFFGIAWPNMIIFDLGMIVLAIPPLFIYGQKTFVTAYQAVRHGRANMDLLIAIGTGVAFLTGPAVFWTPIANYAGVAAMIMAFHLTGRYIEAMARGRASQAIKKLLELGAKTAVILVDGQEEEIAIDRLQTGDIMLIRPGEKIPTDGKIIEGSTTVDQSMATGESMPVRKGINDLVIGATINQHGLIKVEATKVGRDTFLAQVIRMVEEAQGSKVPIQEFADRITGVFVPTVLIIALATFILWLIFPEFFRSIGNWAQVYLPWVNPELGPLTLAIFATVAVLVIACPCALGLATPTALMVGSGLGAENGVLIRKGEAIQTMKDVHTIVFDKTGTITKGQPEVTDLSPGKSFTEEGLLQLAASVESGSEHPLGTAIVKEARERGIEVKRLEEFSALTGRGVKARVEGAEVLLGSRRLIGEHGISYADRQEQIQRLEGEGKTVILVVVDRKLAGIIAVADALKEDSREAIRELKDLGLKTAMITGDNQRTAQAIAGQVGIEQVVAEVLPDGKVAEIIKLQERLGTIAMVGDGINDAPALAQANVGIAIGTGTDIAIESSDITLVRGELSAVVTAVKLSRATFRKIKQNLFWAFFYNLGAIPLAIMGLLHPVIAEIAMAISSISVVTNANLLRRAAIKPSYLK